jgi:hypothetical protein
VDRLCCRSTSLIPKLSKQFVRCNGARAIAHQHSRAERVIAPAVHAVSFSRAIKKPGRVPPGFRRTCLPNQYTLGFNFCQLQNFSSHTVALYCAAFHCAGNALTAASALPNHGDRQRPSERRPLASVAAFPISPKIKKPGRFLPGFRRSFLPTQYITSVNFSRVTAPHTRSCHTKSRVPSTRSISADQSLQHRSASHHRAESLWHIHARIAATATTAIISGTAQLFLPRSANTSLAAVIPFSAAGNPAYTAI